ncbi:hypothetical protein DCCM_2329 [Desulfocucumis palustris]|uniref:Uncharacterized protein n=1 Tax=Desulfocucumis palustris TaxID=1898651 RepID=A0A2L2XAV1_9FIRM|nr:hypothetical protein DCCM_2329 [Desulfocucumis palustris]
MSFINYEENRRIPATVFMYLYSIVFTAANHNPADNPPQR